MQSSENKNINNSDEGAKCFVTHLECSYTGKEYEPHVLHNLSDSGKPLLVRYDLEAVKQTLPKSTLQTRPSSLWRYRELLPFQHVESIVSLGETMTPLLSCDTLQATLQMSASILIKDEGRLPTGSFKARGIALAVSMAKEMGVERISMPTNGNAGAALAAYCSKANMESFVFLPADTPQTNIDEMAILGAHTFLVNGLIHDCGRIVKEGGTAWFDMSTLKEPYRIEGKKTMGLELAEQLDWILPDVIIYPTGGGTGLIGMWKAFQELEAIGWIEPGKRPRMVAVQSTGCAPIVKAFQEGTRHAELWEGAKHTIAAGIRVPVAVGDFLILDAIRESGGFAVAVTDEAILQAQQQCAREEGILLCPEGAATLAALKQELESGRIQRNEQVVLFNCASGLKYPIKSDRSVHMIDIGQPIDYEWIQSFQSGQK